MDDKIAKFIKICLWTVIIFFIIRCIIWMPGSICDLLGAIGEVVSITIFVMGIYCYVIWRWNPLEKTPRIMGLYEGTIEYNFHGEDEKKEVLELVEEF